MSLMIIEKEPSALDDLIKGEEEWERVLDSQIDLRFNESEGYESIFNTAKELRKRIDSDLEVWQYCRNRLDEAIACFDDFDEYKRHKTDFKLSYYFVITPEHLKNSCQVDIIRTLCYDDVKVSNVSQEFFQKSEELFTTYYNFPNLPNNIMKGTDSLKFLQSLFTDLSDNRYHSDHEVKDGNVKIHNKKEWKLGEVEFDEEMHYNDYLDSEFDEMYKLAVPKKHRRYMKSKEIIYEVSNIAKKVLSVKKLREEAEHSQRLYRAVIEGKLDVKPYSFAAAMGELFNKD